MYRNYISQRDIKFYNLALKVAKYSDCSDKHGTVIIKSGALIAQKPNRLIDHPISIKWKKRTIHSEQRTLIYCARKGINVEGCTLYTARLNIFNPNSKPCDMCFHLLQEAGISRIVFNSGRSLVSTRL